MLDDKTVTAFMEKNGAELNSLPDDFLEELPDQMLLYEWEGAMTDEIKQNA